MSMKSGIEKLAHDIVEHAKQMLLAIHGEKGADAALGQLADALKKKADGLIDSGEKAAEGALSSKDAPKV